MQRAALWDQGAGGRQPPPNQGLEGRVRGRTVTGEGNVWIGEGRGLLKDKNTAGMIRLAGGKGLSGERGQYGPLWARIREKGGLTSS